MTCSKCGQSVPDNINFCPSCGQPTVQTGESAAVPVAPPVAQPQSPQPAAQWQAPPQGNGIQEKNHLYTNQTAIIVSSILAGLLLIGGGVYLVYQANLKKADLAVQRAAEDFSTGSNNDYSVSAPTNTQKAGEYSTTWAAYLFAKTKVTYKNPGLSEVKTVYNPKVAQGSFDFTFLDLDSRFVKDGYDYYKSTRIQILDDGTMNSENNDELVTDKTYKHGSLVLTESMISTLLSSAKSSALAKSGTLGESYAIFYNDGVSELAPAYWDVYFTKSGQDESSVGYREYKAVAVRLLGSDLSEQRIGDSTLSYEITK